MLGCLRQGFGAAVHRVASAAPLSSACSKSGALLAGTPRLVSASLMWSSEGHMQKGMVSAAGVNAGVFGMILSKGLIATRKSFDAVAAGERSVGTVHRGILRGNIKEAWEQREIQRLSAARDPNHFDDFNVGDHIVVRHVDVDSPGRYLTFGGVCIAKYGGNKLMRSFRMRNHVDGVGVEMHFAYFAPHIKGIQLLRKKTRSTKRAKWYFLRDKPAKEYTVTWKEKELKLPRPFK